MNLPGHVDANLRLPFSVVMRRHVISPATLDDLLAAFTWSLKCLALGVHPRTRHDGTPFRDDDRKRAKNAGSDLSVRGLLVELRGDWACMRDIFRLPSWSGSATSLCCWRCTATHETRRICGSDAPWRTERTSHFGLLSRWRVNGIEPSPILAAPFFSADVFQLDWLHVMDIGILCDFLGNVFLLLVQRHCPGANVKERVQELLIFGWRCRKPQIRTPLVQEETRRQATLPPRMNIRNFTNESTSITGGPAWITDLRR